MYGLRKDNGMAKVTKRTQKKKKSQFKQPFWIAMGVGIVLLVGVTAFALTRQDSTPNDYVPEVTGAPRVAVSEELIDYGDVKLNDTIETVFTISNVGDRALHILGEPPVEVVEGC